MIERAWVQKNGREWYGGVDAPDGGSKDWGPYDSRQTAVDVVLAMVHDAFDEPLEESQIVELPPPPPEDEE